MNYSFRFYNSFGKISFRNTFFASAYESLIIRFIISINSLFNDLPLYLDKMGTILPAITFEMMGYEGFPISNTIFYNFPNS